MTPDAVVFDFDGVLANTEPLHLRVYQMLSAEHGFSFTADEYYSRYLGFDDVGVFEALSRDKGLRVDGDRMAALIERKTVLFQSLVRESPVLFPGTAECLRAMRATCPIAIASGALSHEIALILTSAGLDGLVPVVVAAGDTPRGKPAPDPYRLAMERLSAAAGRHLRPEASVAIEDSRWGLESARDAGLLTVGLTTSYAASELGRPDLVLSDIAEATPARLGALVAAAGARRAEAGA
jgi:beta-phosphoglucomutase